MKAKYIDNYGQTWQRVGHYKVWNEQCGYGVWDNGRGLKKL